MFMNLELNWQQIVLKVESSNQKLVKKIQVSQNQRNERYKSELKAQLKHQDSISKKMNNLKMQECIKESITIQRNKSQAIRAVRLQQQRQYHLFNRDTKTTQDVMKDSELFFKNKSFVSKTNSIQNNIFFINREPRIDTQAKKLKKINFPIPQIKAISFENENANIKNVKKLNQSCIQKLKEVQSGSKQKLSRQIRITNNTKTQETEIVSSIQNEYFASSQQTLPRKSIRKMIQVYQGRKSEETNKSLKIHLLSPAYFERKYKVERKTKLANIEPKFFKERFDQIQVKGQVKQLSDSKTENSSNKPMFHQKKQNNPTPDEFSKLLNSHFS